MLADGLGGDRDLGGDDSAGAGALADVLGAVPLSGDDGEGAAVGTTERAGEAEQVVLEHDAVGHLAAFADADGAVLRRAPDGALRVEGDAVGTAVEGFVLSIHDENDREVARGECGEICIRGPGVMKGYWGKPEDTDRALRNGWLHSGDIGKMDVQGYVYIVDRVKDMINVSGFKVWPVEVEHVLYRHPAVKECAVYGAPHPVTGEQVRAAIVLKEGASVATEAFAQFCRDRLAAYKTPERVEIAQELPKSATGKILKRVLRDQAAKAI